MTLDVFIMAGQITVAAERLICLLPLSVYDVVCKERELRMRELARKGI